MESVLLKKPQGVSLMDYFNSLDIFDKRQLINELSDAKSSIDDSVKASMPYFMIVLVSSILGVILVPTIVAFTYFGLITVIFGFLFLKKIKGSLNFKFVIDHMKENM